MDTRSPKSAIPSLYAVEALREQGYRVLHTLGSGSGGQVFKALQPNTGQIVAVKLLSLDEVDGDLQARRRERFRREIAICSRLYHPDIVRLMGSGDLADNRHFAVFEYIPGKTLAEVVRDQGMLTVKRTRELMLQLLPALAYAHANGIAHRDFKPSNIMVTTDGVRDRVKILDFGISVATRRDVADHGRLTLSHEWVGTPAYAAPEQLRGENADEKSDLYAWGLIFLECLTGSAVVRGSSLVEIIEQQLKSGAHELPPVLRQHRLGGLLARVLEKDPQRRPNDANLLLSLIERISLADLEDAQGYLRQSLTFEGRREARLSDTLIDEPRVRPAERRSVSIVCCRTFLSRPSGIATPEDVEAQLDDASVLFAELIRQFGATHAQSLGEYTLFYFGLSPARDRDSRLAVRLALELVNRLERNNSRPNASALGVQVGIHSASVAIDRQLAPVGGVGARLAMQLASLGTSSNRDAPRIVVSESFRQLAARFAEFEPHPATSALQLPFSTEPLAVYELLGESEQGGPRAERAVFVGREQELAQAERSWRQARESGIAAALLVTGEPGIGKSRLVTELMAPIRAEGVRVLELRCFPEWESAYMRPLSNLLLRELNVRDPDPEHTGAKLLQLIQKLGLDPSVSAPLFAGWLSLPLAAGYAPLAWSPQKRRQLLCQCLVDALIALMEQGAVLWCEDIHWADASTLECLDALLTRAAARATFVVMTARAGLKIAWTRPPEVIRLAGLGLEAVKDLIRAIHKQVGPNVELLEQIAERSDGVPLYVEELALAAHDQRQALQTTAMDSPAALSSPTPVSLRELLQSRFQELGRARQAAQFGAALGREFSLAELCSLHPEDEFSLLGDVEELVSHDLLVRRLRVDGASYRFRHALIRDAVYESMNESLRRSTHERIARSLEERLPRIVDEQPDVVAHHWECARDPERAFQYWQRAAMRSILASAHDQALAQLERAMAQLAALPESPARAAREADVLLARGMTLVAKRGYTDPGVVPSFEGVIQRVAASGDTLEVAFAARWGLWYYHITQARLSEASRIADSLRHLADAAGRRALTLGARHADCMVDFCAGRFREAVDASRACEAVYDFERDRQLAVVRGDDPLVACLSFEALAELLRGNYKVAIARAEQGLALTRRLRLPWTESGMYGQVGWMYLVYGSSGAQTPDVTLAKEHAATGRRLASEFGFPFWQIYAELIEAAAGVVSGERAAAEPLRHAAELWRSAGASLGRCWHLVSMAHAASAEGSYEVASTLLEDALDVCARSGMRYFEPEVARHLAELRFEAKNPARDAAAGFRLLESARQVAVSCGANWWLLAIAMSRVRHDSAAPHEARAELAAAVARLPAADQEPPLLRESRSLLATSPG